MTNDPYARAMLTGAILWNFQEDVEALLKRYAVLVPPSNAREFSDSVSELKFWLPLGPLHAFKDAAPDLHSDEAYRNYVRWKVPL